MVKPCVDCGTPEETYDHSSDVRCTDCKKHLDLFRKAWSASTDVEVMDAIRRNVTFKPRRKSAN